MDNLFIIPIPERKKFDLNILTVSLYGTFKEKETNLKTKVNPTKAEERELELLKLMLDDLIFGNDLGKSIKNGALRDYRKELIGENKLGVKQSLGANKTTLFGEHKTVSVCRVSIAQQFFKHVMAYQKNRPQLLKDQYSPVLSRVDGAQTIRKSCSVM